MTRSSLTRLWDGLAEEDTAAMAAMLRINDLVSSTGMLMMIAKRVLMILMYSEC